MESNLKSQHGEDAIIESIFNVIGEESRWCVELGALNGTHDSNTWALMQKGWSGVLIEADPTYFEKLKQNYAANPKAHPVNAFASFEGQDSLDAVLARTPIPKEFDLFSLDIDGNEYHVWDSLVHYAPRVMVVEFNQTIPHEVSFVQPRDMRVFQGSSLRALVELGKKKGYELVAANQANAFFVKAALYPKFGIADNSIDVLHTDHSMETKLFQLYDGTLVISGFDRLLFHNVRIDPSKIQLLSESERKYPARISSSPWVRTLKYRVRKMPLYSFIQKLRKRRK